jgi:hypothetical protein
MMRASYRPLWAADSVPACARNTRCCWPHWRRALKRSVRAALSRQQMYGLGYRPAMIQQIALGGTLDTIAYEAVTVT